MAYRELHMIELQEVLRRFTLGDGVRAIARGTGMDRKTVAKYLRAAEALGLQRGGPLPTDEQVSAVIAQVRVPALPAASDATCHRRLYIPHLWRLKIPHPLGGILKVTGA
jgi:hypothetical protein